MPTYLTEEQQAQWLFLGYQKHKRRWRRSGKKPVRKTRRTIRRAFRSKRVEARVKANDGDYMAG
eukprot:4581645-Pyramimonas_sp.AAC.1